MDAHSLLIQTDSRAKKILVIIIGSYAMMISMSLGLLVAFKEDLGQISVEIWATLFALGTLVLSGILLYRARSIFSLEFKTIHHHCLDLEKKLLVLNQEQSQRKDVRQFAHDIRSPLSALLVASEAIHTRPEESAVIIRLAARRINNIAQDLLVDGSSIYCWNEKTKNMSNRLNVKDLLSEVINEKRAEFLYRKDIILECCTQENMNEVFIDQQVDLKRILSNLLNNSIEATMGTQNRIALKAVTDGAQLIIGVEDQGCGVPSSTASRLSNMDDTDFGSTKPQGHGLGISSLKKTLLQVGGKLELSQLRTGGTLVELILPLNRGA